jgi:hypothetical protein
MVYIAIFIVLLNLCLITNGLLGGGRFYNQLSQKPAISRQIHQDITKCAKYEVKRLNCITDDDEDYTDFETLNSDNKLEREMARELYDELRAGQLGLPVTSFLEWEDIQV